MIMYYKYAHPELFEEIPKTDFKKNSGNIVVYGAGFIGLLVAHLLRKQNIEIICFVDKNQEKQSRQYYNLPVISPEEMYKRHFDKMIIITPYVINTIYDEFKSHGLNVVTPFSLLLEFEINDFDNLNDLPEWYYNVSIDYNITMFLRKCVNTLTKFHLGSLEISVSQKCNLRCRECTSLMPYYKNPIDFELETLTQSFEKVIENRLFAILLLEGGETFLWKHLPCFLDYISNRPNIHAVAVITNGTVIPSEKLLLALKRTKTIVRISNYGDLSKIDELKKLFDYYGIVYKLQAQQWYKMSKFNLKPHDENVFKEVIKSCCKIYGDASPHISNGKLFVCPIQANLHNTGIYPSSKEDYIDLLQQNNDQLQATIQKYFKGDHIPEICHHCNGRGFTGIEVPAAQQLEKDEELQVIFE